MKYLNIPLFSLILLVFMSGCCTESECVGEVELSLELIGYPDGEYNLEIERFVKNDNFNTSISKSTSLITWSSQQYLSFYLGHFINDSKTNYDYKVTLLDDGNFFRITNLEIDRNETLRKCGLIKTMEALTCPLASLTVGGPKVSRNGRAILLTK